MDDSYAVKIEAKLVFPINRKSRETQNQSVLISS